MSGTSENDGSTITAGRGGGRRLRRFVASVGVMMAVAGGVVAFGFAGPASASPAAATCPAQDAAGFPVGQTNTSEDPIFCSYPAFAGQDPNDFFCTYSLTTGALATDDDAGFCTANAPLNGGISLATPTINTAAQPTSTTVGGQIADQATLSGGASPTGTVTFNLYDNSSGAGTTLFTDTETLSGGVATSSAYTTTATGTDYWVATYNGDGANNGVTSGASDEPVSVTPQPTTATCPATDDLGFALGNNDTTTDPIFCSYPAVPGENPNDFYCTYGASTGVLVTDNDAGLCPATAVGGTPGKGTPSITTTQQPAAATVGTTIADSATVSGGKSPTGTVTFSLYDNSTASGTPLLTSTQPLSGGSASSIPVESTAATPGTYYWVATYNGDANNNSVTSTASGEPLVISAATPSITTTPQPASTIVGSSITDKAGLSGGYNPTGTITFKLYNNSTASGTPLFSDTETLSSGSATSAGYTTAGTGTDYWVATYNGDGNNNSVSGAANAEPVTITPVKATPTVTTTQQPSSTTFGHSIADKATLSGGSSPTGTVTFNLYNNATATGTPLFTDTKTVSGGSATSAGYTPAAPGTYYWVATYNGDANNNTVTSSASGEPVTITKAATSLKALPQLILFRPLAGVGSNVVAATLTSGGSPVVGQSVSFSDGATHLCTATTNSAGLARCTISNSGQALVLRTNSYTATFAGTTNYVGSSNTTQTITFF
jgi:hypothetical protein